jgi:N-carbamoyl-L-amino-acid hydrolase
MPTMQSARLLADLRTLAGFGAYKTGVHRPTYSPDDIAARRWLMTRLQDAGLDAEMDGVGNVFGTNPGRGVRILSGSHLESQNQAGWLDGAMGVIYALEAARVFRERYPAGEFGVDVIAFADEEGHYASFLGSKSYTGVIGDEEIRAIVGPENGRPVHGALLDAGLLGVPRRRLLDAHPYIGFIEAHIEQGNTLESTGKTIGVVSSIVGIWQYRLIAKGEQNHAGTTMMSRRRDAGLALVRLLAAIDQAFPGIAATHSVWTTGSIHLQPGAKAIIPGHAEALFQFRDEDVSVLAGFETLLTRLVADANAAGPCEIELQKISASTPAAMDPGFQQAIERTAQRLHPGAELRLPGGAGHDAQWLARKMPTAMMFVPSIGGISHHWSENTSDEDLVRGAEVFVEAIAEILASK